MAGGLVVIDDPADPVSVEVPAEHGRQATDVASKGRELVRGKMDREHAVPKMQLAAITDRE